MRKNKLHHSAYSFLQSCVTNARNSPLLLRFAPGLEKNNRTAWWSLFFSFHLSTYIQIIDTFNRLFFRYTSLEILAVALVCRPQAVLYT